jgi:galactosamine-6-phosphate isomerase
MMEHAGIRFEVAEDTEELGVRAAEFLAAEFRRRPELLLCAATGDTPTRCYGRLAEMAAREAGLASRLRVIKLDEWGGLAMDDSATCEAYLKRHLIGPLKVARERYIGFQSDAVDPEAECRRVRGQLLETGPIDVCVLGIGANGHLALNEPGEFLEPFAHVAKLSGASIVHPMLRNARGPVHYGLTLGMAEIMASRRVLFLVSGAHKREPMRRFLERRIAADFPASFLWMHPAVTCLCDRAAVEGLGVS